VDRYYTDTAGGTAFSGARGLCVECCAFSLSCEYHLWDK